MIIQKQRTILLVEDEAVIAMAEARIVKQFGYDVITAGSGEKAVELATGDASIDLVLMDIDLGRGMSGHEVAEQILQRRTVPIVFLTSHAEREMVEKVRGITRYGYVIKNSGSFVLQSSIEMAFDLFEAHQVNEAKMEALRESEARFRSLIENAPVAIFVSRDGIGVYANQRMLDLAGLQSVEECIGRPVADYFAPEFREASRERSRRRSKDLSAPAEFESFALRGDGSLRAVHVAVARIRLSDGLANIAFVTDTTERMRAREELLNERAMLRNVIDNLPEPIYVKDMEGRKIIANLAEARYSGRKTVEEVLGKTDEELYSSDVAAKSKSEEEELRATGKPLLSYEGSFVSADGKPHWSVGSKILLRDANGVPSGILGITHDITERRQAESALVLSESKLRAVLENSTDAIGVHINGIWEMCNPAAVRLFGASSPQEVLGTPIINVIAPQERKRIADFVRNRKAGVDVPEAYVTVGLRADGTQFDMDVTLSTFTLDGIQHALVILRDITERKLADEKIRSLLQEKELLLKEVHHRIKNNMNTVMSLLVLQADISKDQRIGTALRDAANRLRSMGVLYDKLYRSINFHEMSVLEYLPPLVDEIVRNLPRSGMVTINKNIEDFRLDVTRLSPLGIVINEILTNIMKHAFIGRERGVITVSASKKNNLATIVLCDDGVGIPESVDFSSSSGFGLQLVKMLTDQLEGRIDIERGNGTKFILEFQI